MFSEGGGDGGGGVGEDWGEGGRRGGVSERREGGERWGGKGAVTLPLLLFVVVSAVPVVFVHRRYDTCLMFCDLMALCFFSLGSAFLSRRGAPKK